MALDLLTTIELDMQNPYSSSSIVHVNQYDTAGRIKAQLLNGGVKWQVPQGAKPVVMFKKTDNIGGFYDVTELNPSTAAVTVDGSDSSIIYITLDQQTTTTATPTGQYVNMQVAFYQNSARLSTFAFHMQVAESVVTSGDIHSNWLFNILSQEIAQILTDATTPEFISQWLENNITQETGYVIDDSLTIHGAASDAQATGKMVTVSDTNPGISANKVWVKKTPSEIVVPTEDEVEDLRNTLNADFKNIIGEYNKFDDVSFTNGYYISEQGVITEGASFAYSSLIPVEDGTYRFIWELISGNKTLRVHGYDLNGDWTNQIYSTTTRETFNISINGIAYVRISYNVQSQKLVGFYKTLNIADNISNTIDLLNNKTVEKTDIQYAEISDDGILKPSEDIYAYVAIITLNKGLYSFTIGNRNITCRAGFSNVLYSGDNITLENTKNIGNNTTVISDGTYKYLYIYYRSRSYQSTTLSISHSFLVDDTLSIEGSAADAKAVGDTFNLFFNNEVADLSYPEYSVFIGATAGLWNNTNNPTSLIKPIPKNSKKVTIVSNANNKSVIAFLKSNGHVVGDEPDYATGSERTSIPSNTTKVYVVPDDAKFLYIQKVWNNIVYTPQSVTFISINNAGNIIPLGLHEKPESESTLNIIKRCRQMTDIKWTPAVDLDRFMRVQTGGFAKPDTAEVQYYLGKFKAGVEYKGVPYGRVSETCSAYGYNYATVGNYVDFDAFISSVFNPKSRLCEANVGSVQGHRSMIYASVCSGMTCYALNVAEVPTANIGDISGLQLIGKLNDDGTLLSDNLIKIGDVLNKPADHTGIITDIIRDENGLIKFVEVSEGTVKGCADRNYNDGQSGGLCIRKGWTRDQLYDVYTWGNYYVYRYTGDVSYTPSPYVNIGDEFDSFRIEQYPIMPYEGNGFVYKTGYVPNNAVKLVITLDGYNYVRVFKDNAEISGSPFAVTKDVNNEINPISVTEIGVGNYNAYLCNITNGNVVNLTYACKWKIIS